MSVTIYPTGEDHYIEGDRRRLVATGGRGNTDSLEVYLTYIDPAYDVEIGLGWFAVEALQLLVDAVHQNYRNGTTL